MALASAVPLTATEATLVRPSAPLFPVSGEMPEMAGRPGAVVSSVATKVADGAETLFRASVAVAVRLLTPSASVMLIDVVQAPLESATSAATRIPPS